MKFLRDRGNFVFMLKCMTLLAVLIAMARTSWNMTGAKLEYFLVAGRYLPAAIYLSITLVAWLGFLLTPFLRPWPLRVTLVAIFLSGTAVDQFFFQLSGAGLSIDMAKTMMENTPMAGDVITGYLRQIVPVWVVAILGAVILSLPVRHAVSFSGWFGLVPIGALAAIIMTVHLTRGGAVEFPSPYAVPAKFTVASILKPYDGERDKVAYGGAVRPMTRHIVLIVDESIRGDYLGINKPRFANTPYLSANARKIANFGTAVASWNCSKESRLILRTGIQARQLPDIDEAAFHQPSIWQFARLAGFKTLYMDAWGTEGRLHSYMNSAELAQIDERVLFQQTDGPSRDTHLARRLAAILSSRKPQFIVVSKYGAHFPYYRSYPADFAPFDTGPEAGPGLGGGMEYVLNSYHNALQWSVDHFFQLLARHAPLDNTVIVYTSDHGQSLFQGGYKLTHCSKGNVHDGEALVPLFVMSAQGALLERFRRNTVRSADRMTHFQIFPTLLRLMGYEKDWVRQTYGGGLLSAPPRRRRFMTGDMFSRLRGNKWIAVD